MPYSSRVWGSLLADWKTILASSARDWVSKNPGWTALLAISGGTIWLVKERPEIFQAGVTALANSELPSGWQLLSIALVLFVFYRQESSARRCETNHTECLLDNRDLRNRLENAELELRQFFDRFAHLDSRKEDLPVSVDRRHARGHKD